MPQIMKRQVLPKRNQEYLRPMRPLFEFQLAEFL